MCIVRIECGISYRSILYDNFDGYLIMLLVCDEDIVIYIV